MADVDGEEESLDEILERVLTSNINNLGNLSEMRFDPNPVTPVDPGDLNKLVDTYAEEYSTLNETMDEINSFMDSLEQQNDSLYTKLQQLLDNSKKTRQEMEAERLKMEAEGQNHSTEDERGNHSSGGDQNEDPSALLK